MASLVATTLISAPLPGLAAEHQPTAPNPNTASLLVQAHQAAASLVRPSELQAQASQAQTPAPAGTEDRDSWAFFKSPIGIAVLATLAVGTGYAIYSAQHDRIHSPGK
jgi:hypothetical protein